MSLIEPAHSDAELTSSGECEHIDHDPAGLFVRQPLGGEGLRRYGPGDVILFREGAHAGLQLTYSLREQI